MLRGGTCSAAASVVYEQIATLGGARVETAENRALPLGALIFIVFQLVTIIAGHGFPPLA
jgi:hypothetical protein